MNVLVFGATGMTGGGVLLECLDDAAVERVTVVGRSPCGVGHEKVREIVHADLFDLDPIVDRLTGFDACFFCLGVSAVGLSEEAYSRVTYDLTLAVAGVLVERNRGMTFCYMSAAGADHTEQGRFMWARVKGRTENALLKLPFKAAWMFRPGYIQPMRGIRSRTRLYNIAYAIAGPVYPLWKRLFPDTVTTTVDLGRAMIHVVEQGYPRPVLENPDINALARERAAREPGRRA